MTEATLDPLRIDREVGVHSVPVRIYKPSGGARACLTLFVHGGGFSWGTLDDYDQICRNLMMATSGTVVSVGYRLAPQHPFPAALDDVVEAAQWAAAHAADLASPRALFILAGDSAGGCLAAGAAQRLRDERALLPDGQLLIYPMIEHHDRTPPGFHDLARRFRPSFADIRGAWEQYLPSPAHVAAPYAIPSRTADLTGLPAAFVLTAAEDPLSVEGQAYAAQLRAARIPTRASRYEGVGHSFLGEPLGAPQVQAALRDVAAWIRELRAGASEAAPWDGRSAP
jgi:acetyl esterase